MPDPSKEREYLFDGSSGFFLADKPVGWKWGPAEFAAPHVIVRADSPAIRALMPSLVTRKQRLKAASKHTGLFNVFSEASFEATPETEWVMPPKFTNLRTGSTYLSEADAMDSAQEGDMVFYSRAPNRPEVPGVLLIVLDPQKRRYMVRRKVLIDDAEAIKDATAITIDAGKLPASPVVVIP